MTKTVVFEQQTNTEYKLKIFCLPVNLFLDLIIIYFRLIFFFQILINFWSFTILTYSNKFQNEMLFP